MVTVLIMATGYDGDYGDYGDYGLVVEKPTWFEFWASPGILLQVLSTVGLPCIFNISRYHEIIVGRLQE